MRISDWSSDVCSSDLDELLVGDEDLLQATLDQLLGQARGDLLPGLGHRLAGLGIDQVLRQLHAAHALGIERRRPAVAGALVDHVLVEEVEDVLRRHALRLVRLQGLRSEEHTSELQSLMRISYAVFCLKKKHKNTIKIKIV